MTAIGAQLDLDTGRRAQRPIWVPAAAWRDALAAVNTGEDRSLDDIEGHLGVVEDLTFREAYARHRFGCRLGHAGARSTAMSWRDDLEGFRLREPDQSVS